MADSRNPYILFNNPNNTRIHTADCQVKQLLQHVTRSERVQVEEMLKRDPGLLLEKSTVTDCSGHTFKDITAFQYAIWALDTHMWKMLLTYLSVDHAVQQLGEWKTRSHSHGEHFNFMPLKNVYQAFLDYYHHMDLYEYTARMGDELDKLCLAIGVKQRELPVHVMHEYCHPSRPFVDADQNIPTFDEAEGLFPCITLHEGSTVYPLSSEAGLGIQFAIVRGRSPQAYCLQDIEWLTSWAQAAVHESGCDFAAISRLSEVRMAEYEALLVKLAATPPQQMKMYPGCPQYGK